MKPNMVTNTTAAEAPSPGPELCDASFALNAPWAGQVFLAGEFNGWDARTTPMRRGDDGVWRVSLRLPPGFYHYKFVADGRWICGPNGCGDRDCTHGCERCVPNPFGSMDLVAIVA